MCIYVPFYEWYCINRFLYSFSNDKKKVLNCTVHVCASPLISFFTIIEDLITFHSSKNLWANI